MFLPFTCEMQVASIKQEYDQVEHELNAERSKLKECDSQINRMTKEQQILQQQLSDLNVERKKMENEVVDCCNICFILLEQAFISAYDIIG
jgi:septal ring factor EnvC (AmiA/AmiB activator)